jgi:uncharacterized membrane protein YfcA
LRASKWSIDQQHSWSQQRYTQHVVIGLNHVQPLHFNMVLSLLAIICACVLSLLGGFIGGISGFGLGIIFQLGWIILGSAGVEGAGDMAASTATLTFSTLTLMGLITYHAYKAPHTIIWSIVLALLPGMLSFVWLGSYILIHVDPQILKQSLGIFFLILALHKLSSDCIKYLTYLGNKYQHKSLPAALNEAEKSSLSPIDISPGRTPRAAEKPDQILQLNTTPTARISAPAPSNQQSPTQSHLIPPGAENSWQYEWSWRSRLVSWLSSRTTQFALLAGCFGGFLGGAIGSAGPPIMIFFAWSGLSAAEIRSTYIITQDLMFPSNFLSKIVLHIFETQYWPLYTFVPVLSAVGTHYGHKIHQSINTEAVLSILQVLILLSTVELTEPGFSTPYSRVMLLIYLLILAGLMAMGVYAAVLRCAYGKGSSAGEQQQVAHQIEEDMNPMSGKSPYSTDIEISAAAMKRETSNLYAEVTILDEDEQMKAIVEQ